MTQKTAYRLTSIPVKPGAVLDALILSLVRGGTQVGSRPPITTDIRAAITLAVKYATEKSDGHFTLMKFTTNWKAGFITPMAHDEITKMVTADTPEMAICIAILEDAGYKLEVLH